MATFSIDFDFPIWKYSHMKTNTQRYMASQIGISESLLSRIISGKKNAAPDIADRLSKLTRTGLKMWLFNSENYILNRKKTFQRVKGKNQQ
jgi:plasmid maintenance system antidote protein VapI